MVASQLHDIVFIIIITWAAQYDTTTRNASMAQRTLHSRFPFVMIVDGERCLFFPSYHCFQLSICRWLNALSCKEIEAALLSQLLQEGRSIFKVGVYPLVRWVRGCLWVRGGGVSYVGGENFPGDKANSAAKFGGVQSQDKTIEWRTAIQQAHFATSCWSGPPDSVFYLNPSPDSLW